MAKQTINIGVIANDRTGDPLRIAFRKTNENFDEVYTTLAGIDVPTDLSELDDSDNLLTVKDYIELQGRISTITSSVVSFTKQPNSLAEDVIDDNLILTRDASGIGGTGGGIYNKAVEESWSAVSSPAGTEWNLDGWSNLDDVKYREYATLREILRNRIGENIVGAELVMHDIFNDKYYTFQFTQWGQGPAHDGSFTYTRRLIDSEKTIGIEYPDGSVQVKAPEEFKHLKRLFVGDTSEDDITPRFAGKFVEAFNTTIYIPDEETYNIPVGTFTVISAGSAAVLIEKRNSAIIYDPNGIQINLWSIKRRTTATLIKTATNTWNIIAGVEVPSDISQLTDTQGLLGSNTPIETGNLSFDGANGITSSDNFEIYVNPSENTDFPSVQFRTDTKNQLYYSASAGVQYTNFLWYSENGLNFIKFQSDDQDLINVWNNIGSYTNTDKIYIYGISEHILSVPLNPSKIYDGFYILEVVEAPSEGGIGVTNSLNFEYTLRYTNTAELNGNDFNIDVKDDVRITGNDTVAIRNNSFNEPITIAANYDGDTKYWYFRVDGNLEFPDGGLLALGSLAPTTSRGAPGDFSGKMIIDSNYIYRCVSDYADGETDIWKRIAWNSEPW